MDGNTSTNGLNSVTAVKRITCVGAGYVGGSTMPVIAKHCPDIRVSVIDVDEKRINSWNSDQLPIYEPNLETIVKSVRGKNLFFSTNIVEEIKTADMIFIAVNTGTKEYGFGAGCAYDLSAWESVARSIARHATEDKTYVIVEKSTVPVKTAEKVVQIIEASRVSSLPKFEVISNPEFLAEGTAVHNLENPDRVLIGGSQTKSGELAVKKLADVYTHWVPKELVITTNLWSAELSKLAANAFLSQRISSINSLSAVCEEIGADIEEVACVIGLDKRVGDKYLKSSVGWGGSCFKKDLLGLIYLCESCHLYEVADYWRGVIKMNEYQKERFSKRIVSQMFGTVKNKKVILLGFAFKKNTSDTRESAAIDVGRNLLKEGADLHIYDPQVTEQEILRVFDKAKVIKNDIYEVAKNAHAVVVATEWDEFVKLDFEKLYGLMEKPAFIFDGRNILNHKLLEKLGFYVYAVGQRSIYEFKV